MDYKEKVEKYIKTGNISDLQAMSELAFDLSCEVQELYELWKKTEYNQEIARIQEYIEMKGKQRKDGKNYTDTQCDKLAKLKSMQENDYILYEMGYRKMKNLLDRLLERKIEISVIDKQAKETLHYNKQ